MHRTQCKHTDIVAHCGGICIQKLHKRGANQWLSSLSLKAFIFAIPDIMGGKLCVPMWAQTHRSLPHDCFAPWAKPLMVWFQALAPKLCCHPWMAPQVRDPLGQNLAAFCVLFSKMSPTKLLSCFTVQLACHTSGDSDPTQQNILT